MLISICIPQYNRSEYLLKVLYSINEQTYKDIEVVISDDCSTDDTQIVIPKYIQKISSSDSQIKFKYIRQPKNLGYDANLRASLESGTGDYLFILGNDDGLNGKDAIQKLVDHLKQFGYPEVTFCNSMEYGVENSTQYQNKFYRCFWERPRCSSRNVQMF